MATEAVEQGEDALFGVLDRIPAALYVTDRDGTVTHFNQACVDLAGRRPEPNVDQWCVTWKLYTEEGEPLPRDRCPMAVAIRQKRKVRGMRAVAERPDGTRVAFELFPTPILDGDRLVGAVNLMIDLRDGGYSEFIRAQASRCRSMARSAGDERTHATLLGMAEQYEEQLIERERAD